MIDNKEDGSNWQVDKLIDSNSKGIINNETILSCDCLESQQRTDPGFGEGKDIGEAVSLGLDFDYRS